MKLTILELVALAAALVAMMAAATAVVLRGERRDRRVAGRLSLAVTPYAIVTLRGREPTAAARVFLNVLREELQQRAV